MHHGSFFRYCVLNFAKNPQTTRLEDNNAPPPRHTVTKIIILPNGEKHEEEVEQVTEYSWRNFFSTINFAKIMQKLSKDRSHRIWMLVQYKSSVNAQSHTNETCLNSIVGSFEASPPSYASNAATSHSQIDQEPSALFWAEMETM